MAQEKKIRLGMNINGQEPCYYVDHGWGVTHVWAKSRYGKTSMAKTLVVRLGQNRPLIAFDFYGDWQGLGDYNWKISDPHFNRNYEYAVPERIDDLKIVDNPAFQISDFDKYDDWISWGFPDIASSAMAELAACENLHHDDCEQFEELLKAIPTDEIEAEDFKDTYPDADIGRIFPQSKNSILSRWPFIKKYFGEPRTVTHWGEYLRKHNQIVVNMNVSGKYTSIEKARAFTGKILSQLRDYPKGSSKSYLELLKPIIILEEADKLLPRQPQDAALESSVASEVIELILKLQRTGTAVVMITQDPDRLDRIIAKQYHSKIMGKLPPKTFDEDLTFSLRWDVANNYRQFVILRENGTYEIFVPDFCPCK